MKVLLVEDEPEVGKIILAFLKKWEMDGAWASGPEQALAHLEEFGADLLITDLVMPEMSGIEMVRRIRSEEKHRHMPVLMISGQAKKEHILEASEAGVSGFVAKPFQPADLKKKIATALRGRRQQQVNYYIKRLAEERATLYSNVTGPLIVFGEAVKTADDLRRPEARPLIDYLSFALEAIDQANTRPPDGKLSFILESHTTSIVAQLKKQATRKWVRLVMLSTQCSGNPILIVRLFTINHRDHIPIVLIYNHAGEIKPAYRDGFKKLGVRLISRSKFTRERFKMLIDQYVLQLKPSKKKRPATELTPQNLRQKILEDIEVMTTLPTLPKVYDKILRLSQDPKSDLKEWIAAIKVDPMTCAAIFRHINSLNYGFDGEISAIDRAIILLGKRTVLGLVASEAVRQTFSLVEDQGFDLEAFSMHNLATGFAAHLLALPLDADQANATQQKDLTALNLPRDVFELLKRINLPKRLKLDYERENPFVGGIMHDLGKGVMVHAYPGLFPMLLSALEEKGETRPMLDAEREIAGGLTHPLAGEILARKWQLGDALCNAILHHHQPEIDNSFAFLIGLADAVAQSICPFPKTSRPPMKRALVEGDLQPVHRLLPDGFFDQPVITPKEFTALALAITPKVKYLTTQMQQAVE
ncbi:MAG: two-component system chemotaxis response regulator CheY [Candidatus Latescibacterota bacterium]|jgi:two-component system chemotaxis response regulator CheY